MPNKLIRNAKKWSTSLKLFSCKRQEIGDNLTSIIFNISYSLPIVLTLPKFRRSLRSSLSRKESYSEEDSVSPLRCIVGEQITMVLREVHSDEGSEHQGGSRLPKQVMHLGYYWLTMQADSLSFTPRCQACQLHGNKSQAPAVELHNLATPWPFHT